MSKQNNGKIALASFLGIMFTLLGIAAAVASYMVSAVASNPLYKQICLYGGAGLFGVGVIMIIVCSAKYRKMDKLAEKRKHNDAMGIPQGNVELMADAEAKLQGTSYYNGAPVQYIPSQEAYEFVNVGKRQSADDKFEQISKMDRTQFVIYVARLFSRKGYQVKLTPVLDNFDIDMVVQKMGVTVAVGCLITNKVLSDADIRCVAEGKRYYQVHNSMVVTNMYFDHSALEFAKQNQMSLVDRNILASDFMN